jgi:gluconolactonase
MLKEFARPAIGIVLLLSASTAWAQTVEVAAAINVGLEGPTADAAGNVYFTDGGNNRILRLGTDGKVSTFRQPSNRANGLVFDTQFRLIAAEAGDRATNTPPRVTRTDMKTGRIEVLSETGRDGFSYQAPNDVTYDNKGRLYFTDLPGAGVFRIDTDGKVTKILADPVVDAPDGIMLSLDDKTLYIIEQNRAANRARRIRAFDLSPDGTPSNPRVFHDFYPGRGGDGMSIDVEGNLYVAAGMNQLRGTSETLINKAGIYIFTPAGVLTQMVPIPMDSITNCAFGGTDMKTLYVTAGNTLFKFQTKIAGTRR